MSNPPRRRARRTSQTSITLRIMMLANLVIFFTLCFFLNRILTIGLMNNIRDDYQAPSLVRKERDADCSQKQRSIKPCPIAEKRADLQLLPVLRKKHDKDYYRNKYGKDYLPLAWLMSFPVSSCQLILFCVLCLFNLTHQRTLAHPTRAISCGLSLENLLPLIIKVNMTSPYTKQLIES